jgi:hypothetical protein
MRRAIKGFIAVVAALSVMGACGGQTAGQDDKLGGETNWLGDCSTTGKCLVGECICGLCTDHCTTDQDCGGDGTATCVTENGVIFQAACGDTPDVTSICVGHCQTSDDCVDGTTCVAGSCLAPHKVSGKTTETTSGTTSIDSFISEMAGPSGADALLGQCLPQPLTVKPDGSAPCVLVYATAGPSCDCSGPALAPASSDAAMFAAKQLALLGKCGGPGEVACEDMCLCEVTQATGAALDACQTNLDAPPAEGWCYVDPVYLIGNSELVSNCPDGQKRLVRVPALGDGTILMACSTTSSAVDFQATAPGALGDFCMPPDEYRAVFSGFDEGEVNVASGYLGCESGICLVHHFQGRASCPYGNEQTGGTCVTPAGEAVTAFVRAQLLERRPADAILCSCQCAGRDPDAKYCTCPTGFECREMVPDFSELGVGDRAGSYCIKAGTYVADPKLISPAACSLQALNCESP